MEARLACELLWPLRPHQEQGIRARGQVLPRRVTPAPGHWHLEGRAADGHVRRHAHFFAPLTWLGTSASSPDEGEERRTTVILPWRPPPAAAALPRAGASRSGGPARVGEGQAPHGGISDPGLRHSGGRGPA